MKTIKEFTQQTHLDAGLVRGVIRQSGGFESFKESAQDICNHGAACGFNGFTYYTDTVAFYGRNRASINALAASLASDIGEGGAIELISGFNCIKGDYSADEIGVTMYGNKSRMDAQIANALSWFALEEVARAWCDALDSEEE